MSQELYLQLKQDCRYFEASKPCKPHKNMGVFCDNCEYYYKVEKRIMIIKFGSLGDVVRTTSILPGLRRQYPFAHITWVTSPNAVSVFMNNPMVNSVLTDPSEYLPLIGTVTFDLLINLETDIRSSALAAKVNAKEKRGYAIREDGIVVPVDEDAIEWYTLGVNDKLKKENTKTYYEHIYRVAGIPYANEKPQLFLTEEELAVKKKFIGQNNLKRSKKVIGINTGSGGRWPLKKWTKSHYTALMNTLSVKYPSVGVVLFGGPEEKELNADLLNSVPGSVVDAGTGNSMREFFSLVNAVDILFTPDSLAFHVGVALEKTVVVYTGPTSYSELDVFGKGAIIHSDIECLVCYLNQCNKEKNCMNTLSVEYVLNTLKQYFE
ncbi:MAG: glycosyltransferase family 9 protein [Ignavibacteria bacterium]|nr:glycosyltransferase family 9 protein [Ignavibacteria bacterium]